MQIATNMVNLCIESKHLIQTQWRLLLFTWFHKYVVFALDTALEVSSYTACVLWWLSAPLQSRKMLQSPTLLIWSLKTTPGPLYISGLQPGHLHLSKRGTTYTVQTCTIMIVYRS